MTILHFPGEERLRLAPHRSSQTRRRLFMFWVLVLSTAFLGVAVIVFVLTRDSFHASRARREAPPAASPVQNTNKDAAAINTMMQETLAAPPPSNPAALFAGHDGKETDTVADSLAQMKETPLLLNEPKAYLRLEEHDNILEHMLLRHVRGPREAIQTPPKEFSITVTEKTEAPLEHEKAMFRPETGQEGKKA